MTGRAAFVVALALAAALGACRAPEAPFPPAQPGVDVEAYRVRLRLDPATLRLDGQAALRVRHPAGLAALSLGLAPQMTVRGVRVDGEPAAFAHEGSRLRVRLPPRAEASGEASEVWVAYGGVPAEGVYRASAAGQDVVFTDAWPQRAAHWLPAVHRPDDAATLDLTLVFPEGLTAVASGQAVGDSLGGGWRHARFRLDRPAPVYTFAFALARFRFLGADTTDAGVPIAHALLPPDAHRASRLARTRAVLDTLAAILGPYPYGSYTTVQVPLRWAGMENAATPFLQAALYADASPGRNVPEEVNVHEAVHQWFGNAVVPADWRDLWLSEAPATYLTTVVYERLDGPDVARRHRLRMAALAPEDARRALAPRALARPADALSPTVYQKGGAVFHLLRLRLGDEAFFQALARIVRDYQSHPLSTEAFQAEMERAAGASLDPLFAYWVWGRGRPALVTRWDRMARTLAWRIEGDGGTLTGVPFELVLRQGGTETVVRATDGAARLPGPERPEVLPVGVPLRVRAGGRLSDIGHRISRAGMRAGARGADSGPRGAVPERRWRSTPR